MEPENATPATGGEEQAGEQQQEQVAEQQAAPQEQQPEPQEQEQQEQEPDLAKVADPHGLKSWIGRREERLKNEITQTIQQNIAWLAQSLQQQQQQQYQPPPQQQPQGPEFDLEHPDQYIMSVVERREQARQQFNQQVAANIQYQIANDPILREDQELAKEVAQMAFSTPVNMNLDAPTNAGWAYAQAKNLALTNKLSQKKNAFAGRTPQNISAGGITPGNQQPSRKAAVKLPADLSDPEIQRAISHWGYTQEQLEDMFGKK